MSDVGHKPGEAPSPQPSPRGGGGGQTTLKEASWLTAVGGAALVGMLLIFALLGLMLWVNRPAPNVPVDPEAKTPQQKLAETQAAARDELTTYGWVDRPQGVVRVPVEQAVEMVLRERGEQGERGERGERAPE